MWLGVIKCQVIYSMSVACVRLQYKKKNNQRFSFIFWLGNFNFKANKTCTPVLYFTQPTTRDN